MKIIISIVAVMFYAVIGCFISEMVDEGYDPLYILFWPMVIACFIPIWIVSGLFKGIGWLSRKMMRKGKRLLNIQSPSFNKKKHRAYAHIDQNIEKRWEQEEKL